MHAYFWRKYVVACPKRKTPNVRWKIAQTDAPDLTQVADLQGNKVVSG